MSVNIVVPEMGESIVDARVAKWLKNEGDVVAVGEPLVELETDKVDVEVSAPRAGVLAKVAYAKGADVKIGDVLGMIEEGPAGSAGAAAVPPTRAAASKGAANSSPVSPASPSASGTPAALPKDTTGGAASAAPATPSARRLAREENVELSRVTTQGPRVTKSDVQKTIAGPPAVDGVRPVAKPPAAPARTEERVRMSKRRATIARRLVEAQQTAAMLTTFNEVDMSAVMALRDRQKQAFKDKYGVSLGIASFFVKAAVAALREFPRLNAEIQADEMVLKHYYDIGVAVGAAEGLVVPVLRDADRLTFAEIELGIREFARKAGDGTLTLDDLRGGTFSITNGGVFGSLMSTPILNPPQVGILGLHAIKDRPVGVNGQLVLRPMMYTALTYDHRIVDGSEAVRFLVRIKTLVEDPGVLLVES
jgi:2-oxoglutarate dehydrogenase E2 component (dihydrolipoamide succinyltransferase)